MNERQKKFVAAYARLGNAAQAAIEAGYSAKTARQIGQALLTKIDIKNAVAVLTEKTHSDLIATAQERQQMLTEIMRDKNQRVSDRLKANELLSRMQGDFIERIEHSGGQELRVTVTRKIVHAISENEG